MASEYVLITKQKLQSMEKDVNNASSSPGSVSTSTTDVTHTTSNESTASMSKHNSPPSSSLLLSSESDSRLTSHSKDHRKRTANLNATTSDQFGSHCFDNNGMFPDSDTNCSDDHHEDLYSVADIVETFDNEDVAYIEPLLKSITDTNKKKNILSWNEQTGEIVFNNETIVGSNILALLSDTVMGNLNPTGKMHFLRGLREINVSPTLIRDKKTRALLSAIDGNRIQKAKRSKLDYHMQDENEDETINDDSDWLIW